MPYYNLAAALEAQRVAEAEEKEIEAFFCTPITEVTISTGTRSLTVPVSNITGFRVVHELLLAAASKSQQVQINLLDYRSEEAPTPAPKKTRKGGQAR